MTDFIGKLLSIFLTFFLLVLSPLLIVSYSEDLTMKRETFNEMANFIDRVTDTGRLSDEEIQDFYLGCSSRGVVMNTSISRMIRIIQPNGVTNPDGTSGTYVTYTPSTNIKNWNKGDVVKVHCEAVDYTGLQKALYSILGMTLERFNAPLAGRVRC